MSKTIKRDDADWPLSLAPEWASTVELAKKGAMVQLHFAGTLLDRPNEFDKDGNEVDRYPVVSLEQTYSRVGDLVDYVRFPVEVAFDLTDADAALVREAASVLAEAADTIEASTDPVGHAKRILMERAAAVRNDKPKGEAE